MGRDVSLVMLSNEIVMTIVTMSTKTYYEGARRGLPMAKIITNMQNHVNAMLQVADEKGLPKPLIEVYYDDEKSPEVEQLLERSGGEWEAGFSFKIKADPKHWSYDGLGGEEYDP